MFFLKRYAQTALVLLCILASCRGRQPIGDSCPNSIPLPEGKAEHEQIGGFVSVKYFQEVMDHSHLVEDQYVSGKGLDIESDEGKYLKQFIARQKNGILNSQHCSTFLDFIPNSSDSPADSNYEIHFWTSKHCIAFPFIDKLDFYISTPQGFIKIAASEPLFTSSLVLRPYLSIDPAFFSQLFLYRMGDMHRASTAINLYQKRDKFLATDGLDEGTAYSRNLCNSFRRDGVQIKPFQMDKACFNFLDLAVFKAKLDLSSLEEAQRNTLLPMITQQMAAKSNFYQRNPEIRDVLHDWHRIMKLQWINGYRSNLERARTYAQGGCVQISDSPTLFKGEKGTFCDHEPALLALELEWQTMQSMADELTTEDLLDIRGGPTNRNGHLSNFNEINISQTLPGWQKLGQILAGYEHLFVHWNYFDSEKKQAHYSSFSMDDILKVSLVPPIWHEGGLALVGKSKSLPWVQGDSGAIVSFAGMIPILSLSSMNDDETTGGRATVSLPMFEASENGAFREEKQQVNIQTDRGKQQVVRSQSDKNNPSNDSDAKNSPYEDTPEQHHEARAQRKCT